MQEAKLITAEELAKLIRCSKQAVYNALSEGSEGIKIPPSVLIGRRRLWFMSDVQKWLDALPRLAGKESNEASIKPAPKLNKI